MASRARCAAQWLEHVGGVMSEVLDLLAARVYGANPRCKLGLMCSHPSMHATERRDWDRVARAVAGPHGVFTFRPGMGFYQEWLPRGLYDSRQCVANTLNCVRMPGHACSEVENDSYSRFAKSVSMTRAQVLLSAALRCPSVTLDIYDHLGTPLAQEPQYGRMLKEIRPMTDALAEAYRPEGIERGFGMLAPRIGRST